ncbi:SMC-Scp complex subunit ScpB, partial [Faecalibaculum rodentium]
DLVEYAGRWRFVARAEVFPYAQDLFREVRPASLSAAALETLAVIAYRQPVTRVQIEEIRGVACDTMLKKLLARGYIEARDRLDAVGRPLLYRVTDAFLDAFSLEDLQSLPELSAEGGQASLFDEVTEEPEESSADDSGPGTGQGG